MTGLILFLVQDLFFFVSYAPKNLVIYAQFPETSVSVIFIIFFNNLRSHTCFSSSSFFQPRKGYNQTKQVLERFLAICIFWNFVYACASKFLFYILSYLYFYVMWWYWFYVCTKKSILKKKTLKMCAPKKLLNSDITLIYIHLIYSSISKFFVGEFLRFSNKNTKNIMKTKNLKIL